MYVNMSPTFHPRSSSTVASSRGSIYELGAQVSLGDSAFNSFGYTPRRGIAESCDNLFLIFEELRYSYRQELYHITFPSWVSHFLTCFPALFFLLNSSEPSACEVESHCSFDSNFPSD